MALLSTFKDSFTTPTVSACWDVALNQALGHGTHGAADAGEGVQLYYDGTNGPPFGFFTNEIHTNDAWEFTDDATWVQVHTYPAGAEASFEVLGASSQTPFPGAWEVRFFLTAAGTYLWQIDTPLAGGGNFPGVPDPGRHWFRARHDSGTGLLYAESSSDGVTWTTDGSVSIGVGITLSDTTAELAGGGAGPVIFKHFNGGGKPCCPSHPCSQQRSRSFLLC